MIVIFGWNLVENSKHKSKLQNRMVQSEAVEWKIYSLCVIFSNKKKIDFKIAEIVSTISFERFRMHTL